MGESVTAQIGEPPASLELSQGLPRPACPNADWPLGVEHSTLRLLGSHEQIIGEIEQVPGRG